MKITKEYLRKIIKEEIAKILEEFTNETDPAKSEEEAGSCDAKHEGTSHAVWCEFNSNDPHCEKKQTT